MLPPVLLTAPPSECSSLLQPSILNLTFSFGIFFGILISYLPQHHRIITRGTSTGISPLFLLLGVTSGTCAFLNILILSWSVLACCTKGIGAFNCFAASMGVAQVGLQWCCFAIILMLFLIYFPRGENATGSDPSPKTAFAVAIACVVHFIAMASATFYISLLRGHDGRSDEGKPSGPLVAWANFLGLQATVLASIQYLPQLWTTWRLKHVGSLSIPMMCIQTPGSFVWVISLATREGTNWSSWVTYLVTGILQGMLLVMCIIWEMRDRATSKTALRTQPNGNDERADERRPLLSDRERPPPTPEGGD